MTGGKVQENGMNERATYNLFRFKYWIIDLLIGWFPPVENICKADI